ncbi:hypothetical protein CALCODRAFT_206723 [Calocera cornea HHB12733]|uniref:Uncharacterized protein n=1 Tax=Calocera cornea HHB12733 TaxID=1353952 RepID=A0A165K218_9BASI|nr:hypothetical protein CALCODRAFT_206723 [Calocera cornea HHB12733]
MEVNSRSLVQEVFLGTYKAYTTSNALISAAIRRWELVKRFGNNIDILLGFFGQWLRLLQKSQEDGVALDALVHFLGALYPTITGDAQRKQTEDILRLARFARGSLPLPWWSDMPITADRFLLLKPDIVADHLSLVTNSCHQLIRAPHIFFCLIQEDPDEWTFPLLGSHMLFFKIRDWAKKIVERDTTDPKAATKSLTDIVYVRHPIITCVLD